MSKKRVSGHKYKCSGAVNRLNALEKSGERVVVLVSGCLPYCYYRNENHLLNHREMTEILKKVEFEMKRKGVKVKQYEIVEGRPVIGYQNKKSLFCKLVFYSELSRKKLERIAKGFKFSEYVELDITQQQRFIADTGISPGMWIRIPMNSLEHEVSIEQLLSAPKLTKRERIVFTSKYELFKKSFVKVCPVVEQNPTQMAIFRLYIKTSPKEEEYPIAKRTDKLKEERFGKKIIRRSTGMTHEIRAIQIHVYTHHTNGVVEKKTHLLATETRVGWVTFKDKNISYDQ